MYGAWPDALWEHARNLGKFSLGFLWAQKNTSPILFSQHGDQPQYVEYHWHGFQLLWGNIYILGGIALLLILLGIAVRLRHAAPAPRSCRALRRPRRSPRDVAGAGCVVPWRCRSRRCRSRRCTIAAGALAGIVIAAAAPAFGHAGAAQRDRGRAHPVR